MVSTAIVPYQAQMLVFTLLYVSYMACAYTKRSASFFGRDIIDEQLLLPIGRERETWGLFGFLWESMNGFAKVFGAPIVDLVPQPSLLLAASLAIQGVTCILFLAPAKPYWHLSLLFWGLNGFANAMAWPALARVFMSWFSVGSRGTWYAVLATSQNAGAALGPSLTAWVAYTLGADRSGHALDNFPFLTWLKSSAANASNLLLVRLIVPGLVTFFASFFVVAFMEDKPLSHSGSSAESESSSTLEKKDEVKIEKVRKRATRGRSPSPAAPRVAISSATSTSANKKNTLLEITYEILTSPTLWLLGISYLFNSAVRSALVGPSSFRIIMSEWLVPLSLKDSLLTTASSAALVDKVQTAANISFEIGGALGGFFSGLASDRLYNGRRGPIMALTSFVLVPVLLAMAYPDYLISPFLKQNIPISVIISALYFLLGLLAFPLHILNGLASRELSPPSILSSAGGFTKGLGTFGSAMTELYIAQIVGGGFGWSRTLTGVAAIAAASGFLCLPLWNSIGNS
jgi:OPA family sugar phosphate sensor protein UhpC-like MFS transporter